MLVQTRKLLDHNESNSDDSRYKSLRFYCDWTVHVSKDRVDTSTLELLKKFEEDMKSMIGKPHHHAPGPIGFAYFDDLRKDITNFFESQNIDIHVPSADESWLEVITSLVGVLQNQPINIARRHNMLIKTIEFQLSAPGTVWVRAIFKEPFQGSDGKSYRYFDLKNIY